MLPLYTQKEYKESKHHDKLPCQCKLCSKIYYKTKRDINEVLANKTCGDYCSRKCMGISQRTKSIVSCLVCSKKFKKFPNQIIKYPNHFCSHACAATYNNARKTTGTRRSKLENYLESKLIGLYPDLEMHFNRKDAINSELDIYIPSLNLAFELNGIFHYEPIYGQDKLSSIQNNDNRKFQACLERGIELCLIDTSTQKYFKEQTSLQFLNIISDIINKNLI